METVESILREKGVDFQDKGKDFLTLCFNPEHEDSSPSCRVDREDGRFHCFSCGHKGNIYEEFNKQVNVVSHKILELKRKITDLLHETVCQEIPLDALPFEEEYRGISAETFKSFGTYYVEDRVTIPIKDVSGRILAFVGRNMHSKALPKYYVTPVAAKLPIYPHKAQGLTHVLVEGPFDMLNMHDKGAINTSCIFGANNSGDIADRLIPLQMQGVKRLILILDGDEAGYVAAARLQKVIKMKTSFDVEVLELPEGMDPGDLDQEQVDELRSEFNF